MVFSSTVFLFIFLPAVWLLCLILPSVRAKNYLLIAASLVFYAFGEPVYILLMLVSIVGNYFFGLYLGRPGCRAKTALVFAVILNLGMLAVFKYSGFFTESLNAILGTAIPVPVIRLPIGISFYTFQALSYVIDVYRDRTVSQRRLSSVMLYISFFPQLIAGPILKYHDIAEQIQCRTLTVEKTASGIRRFIIGMSKKLLIANAAGFIADTVFGYETALLTSPLAWLGAVAYCIQIYFDFSGYSDMAIGLGSMFGFDIPENFNHPYAAVSIQDFWRRWHISLSTWFKEYLYIPLGGNRHGEFRRGLNRMIVFFCTGLWHGANLTFIVWGLYHGLFLLLEGYGVIPVNRMKKRIFTPLKRIYTLIVVAIGFVIFRAPSMAAAVSFIGAMFAGGFGDTAGYLGELLSPYNITLLVLGVLLSAPLLSLIKKRNTVTETLSYTGTAVLLLLCVMNLSAATYNPFIYYIF